MQPTVVHCTRRLCPACPVASQACCSSGTARTPRTLLMLGRDGWTRMKRWVGGTGQRRALSRAAAEGGQMALAISWVG